ncbi:DsbE family thiol:disulfide interchange protein [Limibacillus halophilus]|jgi:cytochrome c biogenesis protein CcmG/thiol:disulfide interchange protein DsbE
MLRKLLFILPSAIFLGVMAFSLWGLLSDRDPSAVPSNLIDKPVPAFDLPGVEGLETPGLSSALLADGKVKVINVFASWCVPCRAEHPVIEKLAKEHGVTVYGLNYKDKPEDARLWLAELGNPYARIGADRKGRTAIDFGVSGVPETYLIDGEGVIRYQYIGPIVPLDLEEKILPILEEIGG